MKFSTLEKRLSGLEVCASEAEDGSVTIYTTSEPLFCYNLKSKAEIPGVISETLKSYVETFYHVDNVAVSVEETPVEDPKIPVLRLKTTSRYRPSFEGFDNADQRQFA